MVFLLNRHFTFAATAATPAPSPPGAGALVETGQKVFRGWWWRRSGGRSIL
jgi:hypothetical protein